MQNISLDIIYSSIFDTIPVLKKCFNLYQCLDKENTIKLFEAYEYKTGNDSIIIYPIGIYRDDDFPKEDFMKLVYLELSKEDKKSYSIKEMSYLWAKNNIINANLGYLNNKLIDNIYINTFLATKAINSFKIYENNIS